MTVVENPSGFGLSSHEIHLLPQTQREREGCVARSTAYRWQKLLASLRQATVGEGDLVDELRAAGER